MQDQQIPCSGSSALRRCIDFKVTLNGCDAMMCYSRAERLAGFEFAFRVGTRAARWPMHTSSRSGFTLKARTLNREAGSLRTL